MNFFTERKGDAMKIKKIIALILVILIVTSLAASVFAVDFTDVPEEHPYKAAIDFCKAKNYVKGINDTTFMPDSKLTRAELSVLWCRVLGIIDVNHTFTDITKLNKYYDNSAIVLHSLGILKGTSATNFSPEDLVTREQLAVLTMRSYKLGVANPEDYKQYADYESISEWARDGISSCINANVLEGLYDGENFEPKKPVTRAEICKLIYNISMPPHDVIIGTLVGGTITASPEKARPGTLITLTVLPDEGKQLKEGTLKYDDVIIEGTSFIMPDKDVTITAEFEDIEQDEDELVILESITVTNQPDKTTYMVGEELDLSGLVVTATYSDGTSADVTSYTTTPVEGSVLDTEGTIDITITYTEDDVTKTTTFTIQVNENVVEEE